MECVTLHGFELRVAVNFLVFVQNVRSDGLSFFVILVLMCPCYSSYKP